MGGIGSGGLTVHPDALVCDPSGFLVQIKELGLGKTSLGEICLDKIQISLTPAGF